jgi:hypothetical protein
MLNNKKAILSWDTSYFDDDTDYDIEWDFMIDNFNELLKDNEYFKATVTNFGWRNLDGITYFKAENSLELLRKILPDTDCTFYIFKYRNGFKIRNYHHDSPMGNEIYTILPIKYETYCKNI